MPEPPSESLGQAQSIRRAVTLPTKLNPQAQRGSGAPNTSENVIFYHPTAKIVHFAPRALVPIPSSSAPSDFDYPVDTIETLPWRSATERTVATAPLRLEKVHGLTVFLKCGNVVHAILKNSQCWCVDGVSKFVLRIRPLTYYRIELPHGTEDDKRWVEDLKAALPTVLRYEVTPCPFKRAFTVEIPEDAKAPRRKKAWQPKARNDSLAVFSGSSQGTSSESKSEWLDSASMGQNTGATATDHSGFTPKGTSSTASEVLVADIQPPSSVNSSVLPTQPRPTRRAVTETPQTFTSLRAKFDATPMSRAASIPEESPTVQVVAENSTPEQAPAAQEAPVSEEAPAQATVPVAEFPATEETSLPAKTLVREEVPASEEVPAPKDAPMQSVPQVASTPSEAPVSEEALLRQEDPAFTKGSVPGTPLLEADPTPKEEPDPEAPVLEQTSLPEGDLASKKGSVLEAPSSKQTPLPQRAPVVPKEAPLPDGDPVPAGFSVPEEVSVQDNASSGSEPDLDHETSFSSTPESFHSADLSSPSDSISTHTTREEYRDLPQQAQASPVTGIRQSWTTNNLISEPAASIVPPCLGVSPTSDAPTSNESSTAQSRFAYYETRQEPSRPSLTIPSDTTRPPRPVSKSPSPTTDFNHMSTEFRRRAQATRQRDVSPMPPPSAIYQPNPSEKASSILSKALALVLVPPVSLFIILLHITARIVISPALSSSPGESASDPQTSKEPVTEDDFNFPLEREPSSEYEDAETTKQLNPWDLD